MPRSSMSSGSDDDEVSGLPGIQMFSIIVSTLTLSLSFSFETSNNMRLIFTRTDESSTAMSLNENPCTWLDASTSVPSTPDDFPSNSSILRSNFTLSNFNFLISSSDVDDFDDSYLNSCAQSSGSGYFRFLCCSEHIPLVRLPANVLWHRGQVGSVGKNPWKYFRWSSWRNISTAKATYYIVSNCQTVYPNSMSLNIS